MVYVKILSVTVGCWGICCKVGCFGSSSSANGCSLYLLCVTSHQEHCPFSPSNGLISTAPTWRQTILLEFLGPRRQEGGVCVEWLTCCGMLKNQCAVDGSWAGDLSGSALSGHGVLLGLFSTPVAVYCYAHFELWFSSLTNLHLPSFFQGFLMISGPPRALLVVQDDYEFIYLFLYAFCYF